VAAFGILITVAHESHRLALGQFLEESQRKLLTVILDAWILFIKRGVLEEFVLIASGELVPIDLLGLECFEQLLTRSQVCHPNIEPRSTAALRNVAGHEDAEAIMVSDDGTPNGCGADGGHSDGWVGYGSVIYSSTCAATVQMRLRGSSALRSNSPWEPARMSQRDMMVN
jgi:hypothetical protein